MGDWFQVVELEVNSLCNRKCGYCPVSTLAIPSVPKFMPDAVLDKTLQDLADIGFDGRVSFHFYNEPLARKDLHLVVGRVRDALPKAFLLLFTNGDLLTDLRQEQLLQAGLDHTLVTQHDDADYPQRHGQTVQRARDLVFTNRAGLMTDIARLDDPLKRPCFAPSDMMIVGTNGDVLLCCDDASRATSFGNVLEQTVEQIWFSERFVKVRSLLQQGRRAEASPACAKCSNSEYFGRGESYWPDPFKEGTGWVARPKLPESRFAPPPRKSVA